jgi:hypothetical protein
MAMAVRGSDGVANLGASPSKAALLQARVAELEVGLFLFLSASRQVCLDVHELIK